MKASSALAKVATLAVFGFWLPILCPIPVVRGADTAQPDPVRGRLIVDQIVARPGSTVWLGLHLQQDPGWHTYWRNGGDAGYPTAVEWTLPSGYEVGEIHWPVPHRYEEAGGLVTYGYSDEVLLKMPLKVPADAPLGSTVHIQGEASWLMCKDICIPGEATLSRELVVADTAEPAPAADRALFERFDQRLPRSPQDFPQLQFEVALATSAVVPGEESTAAVVVRGAEQDVTWEWFPYESDFVYPGPAVESRLDGELVVGMPFELDASAPVGETVAWGGVLQLDGPGGERFVSLDVAVPTAAEGAAIEPTSREIFTALLGDEVEEDAGVGLLDLPAKSASTDESRSLGYYLLLALVGGIILNVMPCVLPVLSLKILGFVQHAQQDRATVLKLGLVFALGVLASFLALALVVIGLQAAGDQLGWGFQFQNPTFVVIMAAVVFAFGLSLFGVYEIVLPVNFGAGGSGGKYAESFFNGILATALATPCTAPFLGTALGFAFTQPAAAILAIFLTIGVGLSIPYVVLSANPGWLRFVPRPGPWMEKFKQFMGFLLMATLVWLLWVLGQQIGVDGVVWAMAFLTALALALWLYGSFVNLSSSTARRVVMLGLAVAIVAGSWWYFLRGPLAPSSIAVASEGGHTVGGLRWEPFTISALEDNVRQGNTVFVDFTAAWCWTCKVNERTVLADEDVVQKLRDHQVVTLLGDWTNRDPVITQVLRKYGRSGVPFYAIYPAGRLDEAIVLPEVITESIVMEALEDAGPSRGKLTAASR